MTLKMMEILRKNWPLLPKMNWVNFNASSSKSENFTLWCANFVKSTLCLSQKRTGELCHNTEEWCKICRRTELHLKNDIKNLANFEPTLESLTICTLMGLFWSKSLIFQSKKYRRDHYIGLSYRRSMQALKEKWSVFSIMIWRIWWTSREHSKILEFALWEAFFPRYTMLS